MKNIRPYLWYAPALYVAYMFGEKLFEGLSYSDEFQSIISVITPLAPYAHTLTPLVGILDFTVATLLLFGHFFIKNPTFQKSIFVWTMVWPFVPASLRYFGGVAEFEIVNVLSISLAALLAYILWKKFALDNNPVGKLHGTLPR